MPYQDKTIAAKDVQVGDFILNDYAFHPTAAWCRAVAVEPFKPMPGYIKIKTTVFETILHREQGIYCRQSKNN